MLSTSEKLIKQPPSHDGRIGNKMKTIALRKQVKEGIHDGRIDVYNKSETRSLSRFIAYLSKNDCEIIISRGELNVKEYPKALAKSNGVQWSQSSDSSNSGEGNSCLLYTSPSPRDS